MENWKIIYSKSFSEKEGDKGDKSNANKGDIVTFTEVLSFMTRKVAEVRGQILEMEKLGSEKPKIVHFREVSKVSRPPSE